MSETTKLTVRKKRAATYKRREKALLRQEVGAQEVGEGAVVVNERRGN